MIGAPVCRLLLSVFSWYFTCSLSFVSCNLMSNCIVFSCSSICCSCLLIAILSFSTFICFSASSILESTLSFHWLISLSSSLAAILRASNSLRALSASVNISFRFVTSLYMAYCFWAFNTSLVLPTVLLSCF